MRDRFARPRFFAESLEGEVVPLSPSEAHHAVDVLRLALGSEVELFDGAGAVAVGTLAELARGRAAVRISHRRGAKSRPEPWITLAFAAPKGKRLDWLLEKATELGVDRLVPVSFARSVVRVELTAHARRRWRGICVAAAKQCGANFLPEVRRPVGLEGLLSEPGGCLRVLGDVEADTGLLEVLERWSPGNRITLLVGPEGGLDEAERHAAVAAGFIPVRLGDLMLRTETAATGLLAAVRVFCQG